MVGASGGAVERGTGFRATVAIFTVGVYCTENASI